MFALAVIASTALLILAGAVIARTLSAGMPAIRAALAGKSFLAAPMIVTRPVSVRITSRRVSQPVSARVRLRVAA